MVWSVLLLVLLGATTSNSQPGSTSRQRLLQPYLRLPLGGCTARLLVLLCLSARVLGSSCA